jgi:hypothetical protein
MKWKVFLERHLFTITTINCDGMCEVDTKKMDIDTFIQGEPLNKRKERLSSFRLAFCMPILPEKLRCRKIVTVE